MFLKSTPIRNGIAFLEPANVILKGYRTEDHDINGEQVFLSSLRKRLGYANHYITHLAAELTRSQTSRSPTRGTRSSSATRKSACPGTGPACTPTSASTRGATAVPTR